jgi:xylulose-5-phosphate/fructose-6-phosphate phosphoketolase
METKTLSSELLHKMDASWRAANYLSVGQICLCDNPLRSNRWRSPLLTAC